MQIQIKVEANGVARYYLGLARGMVLQVIDIIYIHTHYFYFPPKRKSSPTPFLQNCPARTSMKEKFITPFLEFQKSPNLDRIFLISWEK